MAPAGEFAKVMANSLCHQRLIRATEVLFALLFAGVISHESAIVAGEIHWNDMGQICGYAASVVPLKKVIRRADGKSETLFYRSAMKGVKIALYRAANERTTCCDEEAKAGEVVTAHDGRFQFREYAAGFYWLVIHSQAGDVRVPIRADAYIQGRCEDRNIVRIIFADAQPEPRVEVRIL